MLFLLPFLLLTQEIKEKTVTAADKKGNGFEVSLKYATLESVADKLEKQIKKWNGKPKRKGSSLIGDDLIWNDFSQHPFDIYAEIEKLSDEEVKIICIVDLGGAFLSSSQHSKQADIFKNFLKKFVKDVQKSALEERVKAEEKKLSELESKKADLTKKKNKLNEEIEECQKTIKENENKIKDINKNIEETQSAIELQKKNCEKYNQILKEISK